jgi:hypothetical protein
MVKLMTDKPMGRLALRTAGEFWHAYYALPDTMKNAIWLGSIRMAFIQDNQKRKDAFMELMKGCVKDILEERVGTGQVTWPDPPVPAPESERSGEG